MAGKKKEDQGDYRFGVVRIRMIIPWGQQLPKTVDSLHPRRDKGQE